VLLAFDVAFPVVLQMLEIFTFTMGLSLRLDLLLLQDQSSKGWGHAASYAISTFMMVFHTLDLF
jgi:hypothetical protein